MERKKMLEWIDKVCDELGTVILDEDCGVYYSLIYDYVKCKVDVCKFKGESGYDFVWLNRLPTDKIEMIYNNLKKDFE